jgi:urease accessory protein UreF
MLPGFCRKFLQASVDKICNADIYPSAGIEKFTSDGGQIMVLATTDKQRCLLVLCRKCFTAINQVMAKIPMAVPVNHFFLAVFVVTHPKVYGYIYRNQTNRSISL